MKRKNERKLMEEFVMEVISCVQKWEYTEMYAGKASVFALFLIFLKCMDDIYSKKNESKSFFRMLQHQMYGKQVADECDLRDFFHEISKNWTCDNKIVDMFIKRINIEKVPQSFGFLLKILNCINFADDEKTEELIDTILFLYGDLYTDLNIHKDDKHIGLLPEFLAKELLQNFKGGDIYGFSCGTGALLAMMCETKVNIYGQEPDIEKAIVAYILLRLTSIYKSEVYFNIQLGDVLENPITMQMPDKLFDRILVALPIGKRKMIADKIQLSGIRDEFLFSDSKIDSGAWTYVRHIMKKLKKDGWAVMFTGMSELSREGSSKADRESLLDYGAIDAVVQLPVGSSTDMKLCMLVLHSEESRSSIFIVDLSATAACHLLPDEIGEDKDHLEACKEIARIINEKIEIEGVCKSISYGEIMEHGVNLTPAIYLKSLNDLLSGQGNLEEILKEEQDLGRLYDEANQAFGNAVQNYYNIKGK